MSNDCYGFAFPEVETDFFMTGKAAPAKSFTFSVFLYAVILADFSVMSGIMAMFAATGDQVTGNSGPAAILFMFLIFVLFFNNNLFKIEVIEDFAKAWPRIVAAWGFAGIITAIVMLSTQLQALPGNLHACLMTYAAGLGLMMAERLAMTQLFRYLVRRGSIAHVVAIIGAPDLARRFSGQLAANRFGVRVARVFDDQVAEAMETLVAYEKTHRIDTVVIALPMDDNERMRMLVQGLSAMPANIRILPGNMALEVKSRRYAPYGEIPGMQLMTIADRPIDNWGFIAKSMLDRSVALLALLFFGPVMLICVAGIKLSSPGPVLFRQKRIGYKNEIFEVYKFRSMHVHACNTGRLTERHDARIFKFGHIMRKLSFDELPQIFNVLKGDMSLVGPRPHMPEARAAGKFYFDAVSTYASRHRVKPGITGWAQVCGWRGPTETIEQIENRVAHDLFYIDNWSFGFDVLILIKTAFVGFFGKNAF